MDQQVSEELASLRRLLESHFSGDDEFQGQLGQDLRKVAEEVTALRLDFEKHRATYNEQQRRWRHVLDPEEGGLVRASNGHGAGLNGYTKTVVAIAVGAATGVGVLLQILAQVYETFWKK